MKKLYSKLVETKVTQYLLSHKLVQKVGQLSALPRKETLIWKQALNPYPHQSTAFWARSF